MTFDSLFMFSAHIPLALVSHMEVFLSTTLTTL